MLDSSRRTALVGLAIVLVVCIALFVALRAKKPRDAARALVPDGTESERETVELASPRELEAVTADDPAPLAEAEGEPPTTPTAPTAEPQPPPDPLDSALEAPELADLSGAGTTFDGSSPESDQGDSCLAYTGRLPIEGRRGDSLGTSLAMSVGRMVVGDGPTNDEMPVRISDLVEGSWRAVERIDPPCADHDHREFGKAVAVSGDRVAIARDTCRAGESDAIEIHLRDEDGTWNREAILCSSGAIPAGAEVASQLEGNSDLFATRIALDGDNLAAVGFVPGEYSGARLSLFSGHGSTWNLDATFTPFEHGPFCATSIDLRSDRLAIGAACFDRFSAGEAGAVVTWRRVENVWKEEHRWVQSAAHDTGLFGFALQLVPDGLFVGSPMGVGGSGMVCFLSGVGEAWGVTSILRASPDVGSFGASLAVTGGFLAVGALTTPNGAVLGYLLGEREPMPCGRWNAEGPGLVGLTLAADSGWICAGFAQPASEGRGTGAELDSRDEQPLSPFLLQLQAPAPR